jgi:Tol biopolymer transport system component
MSRQPDPGFDPRIADWLEADPNVAPPDVLRTVTSAIPSIPQRPALRLPWRFSPMLRFALLAAGAVLVVAVGILAAGSQPPTEPAITAPPATTAPTPVPQSPSPTPTPRPTIDPTGDRILFEHFANAPDASEVGEPFDTNRRRLYFLDPENAIGAQEFLAGAGPQGKTSADVSNDGSKVVFMSWSDSARLWEAGIDGSGLHQVTPDDCGCTEWDPAYDPTGTRIVYGIARDGEAWLEVRDLATGETTPLDGTRGPTDRPVPESPDWSPDGRTVVFARTDWGSAPMTLGMVHYGSEPVSSELSLVDVATGDVSLVPVPDLLPGDPHISPDGTRILFTDRPLTKLGGDSDGAFTVRLDGSDLLEVTMNANSAVYLPDGETILVQHNDLRYYDADGGNPRLLPGTVDMTDTSIGYVYVSHWVPAP